MENLTQSAVCLALSDLQIVSLVDLSMEAPHAMSIVGPGADVAAGISGCSKHTVTFLPGAHRLLNS